jgi:hypothetical protein
VVGATAGDLHTKQFWVDKDRLILVRTLEPGRRDSTKTLETQLNHQQQLAGGWIETETLVLVDGKPRWREEYSDVRVDSSSVPTLFDPRTWNRMR